jgi:hypothetical protein
MLALFTQVGWADDGSERTLQNTKDYFVMVHRVLTLETLLRAVVIYDGAFTMDKHSDEMSFEVEGFYQVSAGAAAKMTQFVENGSAFGFPFERAAPSVEVCRCGP